MTLISRFDTTLAEYNATGILGQIGRTLGYETKTSDAVSSPPLAADEVNILSKEGTVFLAKATAGAWLLAAPVAGAPAAGGDDGKVMRIISVNGLAHTVQTPANKINGNMDKMTFAAGSPASANVGDSISLTAYNGLWMVNYLETSVTLSEV